MARNFLLALAVAGVASEALFLRDTPGQKDGTSDGGLSAGEDAGKLAPVTEHSQVADAEGAEMQAGPLNGDGDQEEDTAKVMDDIGAEKIEDGAITEALKDVPTAKMVFASTRWYGVLANKSGMWRLAPNTFADPKKLEKLLEEGNLTMEAAKAVKDAAEMAKTLKFLPTKEEYTKAKAELARTKGTKSPLFRRKKKSTNTGTGATNEATQAEIVAQKHLDKTTKKGESDERNAGRQQVEEAVAQADEIGGNEEQKAEIAAAILQDGERLNEEADAVANEEQKKEVTNEDERTNSTATDAN